MENAKLEEALSKLSRSAEAIARLSRTVHQAASESRDFGALNGRTFPFSAQDGDGGGWTPVVSDGVGAAAGGAAGGDSEGSSSFSEEKGEDQQKLAQASGGGADNSNVDAPTTSSEVMVTPSGLFRLGHESGLLTPVPSFLQEESSEDHTHTESDGSANSDDLHLRF